MNKSKVLTLIKYFVSIDFFAILSIKQNLFKKGKKSNAVQGIISLLVFLGLYIFLAPSIGKFFSTAIASDTTLTSIFIALFVVTLFFSLANAFIFIEKNNESEMLLSLPIAGEDIIKARIYALSITFFLSFYFLMFIAFATCGYYLKLNFLYYIFLFISLIILNTEAVVLSGIIILLFGRLIRKSKFFNKFLKGIYSLFMILIFVIYMLFTQSVQNKQLTLSITTTLKNVDSTLSKVFFFCSWVKDVVLFKDLKTVLISLFIGIISLIVIVFVFNHLSKKNYLEILRCANVVSKESKETIKKRKEKGVAKEREYKFIVLFKKEFFEILTTPTYLMQIVIVDVMILIASFVGLYFGFSYKDEVSFALNSFLSNLSFRDVSLYAFAFGGVIGLFEGISSLTTSSVSREGKSFWIIASAPISAYTSVLSRICASQALHFFAIVIAILLSTLIYVFNPLLYILFILGFLTTLFTSGALNMILGLFNPNFDWKTPKEALNNGSSGLNVFVSILINYGLYALMVFMFYFGDKRKIDIRIITLIDISIVILTGIVSYIIDIKLYKRLLKRL